MPVDPCFEPLLRDARSELRPPPPHVSLERFRAVNRAWQLMAPVVPLDAVEDTRIATAHEMVALKIFRPHAAVTPAIVYFHGGGFVLGDLETHASICSRLAAATGAAVVSVAYPLAPEVRFPRAVDVCHAALTAIAEQAGAFRFDPTRLALAGDSAGANLAVAALLTKGSGRYSVRHAALLYPAVDPTCDFPSMHALGRGYLLSREAMRWCWDCYLPPQAATDPRAALLQADLGGLPPLSISTAEFDPLRDEGEALVERARAAGVPVRARCYPGMVHGFAGMPQLTPIAELAIADIAGDLRTALFSGKA